MKLIRKILIVSMSLCLSLSSIMSSAHSGRTDSSGGHHDYKNASGLGSYHYHHGMGPHLHKNGVCPYSSSAKSSGTKKSSKYYNVTTVRKVQAKLNKHGCKCGRADGYYGTRTKAAIKKFQRKKNMKVNGKITKTLLKKLNLR